jgi:hypothetical protein
LKSLVIIKLIIYIFVVGVLFSCYYNIYFFWAFSGSVGYVFKINFYSLDVFIFLLWVVFLNF